MSEENGPSKKAMLRVCALVAELAGQEPTDGDLQGALSGAEDQLATLLSAKAGRVRKTTLAYEKIMSLARLDFSWDAEVNTPANELDGVLAGLNMLGEELSFALNERDKARVEAVQANRAKSDFLANMSHELRTPMNGVVGMAGLLSRTSLTESQEECVDIIGECAEALVSLIDDMLDCAKIEAGKFSLVFEPLDPRQIVERVVGTLAAHAPDGQPELTCRIAPEVPRLLVGDPGRLRQVLVNLVGNAMKFTPQGVVSVTVEQIPKPDHGTCKLRFCVEDTGEGIDPKDLDSLFEAYSQGSNTFNTRHGGTGLGLAISKQLVEVMGGSVEVESQQGVGSRFVITIPFVLSEDAPDQAPIIAACQGKRVLMADDIVAVRDAVCTYLNDWGITCLHAVDGKAMVEKIEEAERKNAPFDVVMVDHKLPGLAAAEKTLRPYPIIVLATMGTSQPPELAHKSLAILDKPVKQKPLRNALLKAFGAPSLMDSRDSAVDVPPPPQAGRKGRVLVVEDNAINRTLCIRILEQLHHEVKAVANGQEALDCLASEEFDIIIMDLQMPVMDGLEATRRIRASDTSYQSIPIIGLTAHAMEQHRQACLDAGMTDYLSKPVHGEELDLALRQWDPYQSESFGRTGIRRSIKK